MRTGRLTATIAIVLALIGPPGRAVAQSGIGIIDLYGLRSVADSTVRRVIGLEPGDPLPPSMSPIRERLLAIPGVMAVDLAGVCCSDGQLILYFGFSEAASPALRFAGAPTDSVFLPAAVMDSARHLSELVLDGVKQGQAGEDDSHGYSLMDYPPAHAIQQGFVEYAKGDLERLRTVLHHSVDPEQRAVAAQVIAYAEPRAEVVPDLVEAAKDPAPEVRNNAVRALGVMGAWANQHPEAGFSIPLTPFVALLNSLEWTDRNKSSLVLAQLTATRDTADLGLLRREALPSLVEMARWKEPGHALAAFMILGRIAGLEEDAIMGAWNSGDRESVIRAATGH